MNSRTHRPALVWRVPDLGRLRAFFAPPVVAPVDEPATLAAMFGELLAAVRSVGTPEQARAFENRIGREVQGEVRPLLSGVPR